MGLLLLNAGPIAHLSNNPQSETLVGSEITSREELTAPAGSAMLIEENCIMQIGSSEELHAEFAPHVQLDSKHVTKVDSGKHTVWDLAGRAIIPGLVDSHTHLLWSGDRSNELALRQQGYTYKQISEMGGGIAKTVSATRKSSKEQLMEEGRRRISLALRSGTCALEAKSGYGLNTESELLLLAAADELSRNSIIPIQHTWLGAHATPPEMERSEYVEQILAEQLPAVIAQGIASSADVFCEDGWFTIEETEQICNSAKQNNLDIRLHVDEFSDSGGAQLAAELGAVTADHAAWSSAEARSACSKAGTLQGFLPGTPYVLGYDHWPPFLDCIENEWAWSIASDFNPNCNSLSVPFAASLAVHRCGVDPLAALVACTRNAASGMTALEGNHRGTLQVGAPASLNILWGDEIDGWCMTPGHTPFVATVCEGIFVDHQD